MSRIDLTGRKFGQLTVVAFDSTRRLTSGRPRLFWLCKCECGNQAVVVGCNLTSGHTLSCGCLQKEVTQRRSVTHGHTRNRKTTRTYNVWNRMHSRCYDTNDIGYDNYGARGITVYEPWRDFAVFLADVGECPGPKYSIDRYPNQNGNYEPGNVRWATATQQARNTRRNILVTLNGETRCLSEWCELRGHDYQTVYQRIHKLGWSNERALQVIVHG